MRRLLWSRAMLGLVVFAGAAAVTMPPARAQMCSPAIPDCENQADTEARRCAIQCSRYDTICADRCDDTRDISVRYCWIRRDLCKVSIGSGGIVRTWSERR